MIKNILKNKFMRILLSVILIIIIIVSTIFVFYKAKIIQVPQKCYNYSSDAVLCFSIFDKGYWKKQQDSHYLYYPISN